MKKMMKKINILLLVILPTFAFASGGGAHLDHAPVDVTDHESLKRGAKLFMNYCLSCHSAKFMRYKRMADDLGMEDSEVLENLVYTGAKIHDTMDIAMSDADAAAWFGTTPPDLSVISRSRGADWLYTNCLVILFWSHASGAISNQLLGHFFTTIGHIYLLFL